MSHDNSTGHISLRKRALRTASLVITGKQKTRERLHRIYCTTRPCPKKESIPDTTFIFPTFAVGVPYCVDNCGNTHTRASEQDCIFAIINGRQIQPAVHCRRENAASIIAKGGGNVATKERLSFRRGVSICSTRPGTSRPQSHDTEPGPASPLFLSLEVPASQTPTRTTLVTRRQCHTESPTSR